MNQQEILDYLYHKLPMYQRMGSVAFKKDLTNTVQLCKALDNPHRKFKSVHIAGTNGKGSSAHALAAILAAAGYKVGLYTSPHLKNFTERIKINGEEVPFSFVKEFVEGYQELIETISPSFFEITVAMAFQYFATEEVDIAVIETGLGGRLDSTNVVIPEVSLITNISYDHQQMLGDTLPLIAGEKAGIFKKGIPAVIGERQPEVEKVFIDKSREVQSPLHFAEDLYEVKENGIGIDFYRQGQPWLQGVEPQLKGKYQLKNHPGILMALEILQEKGFAVTAAHVKEGIENLVHYTGLKGRWQVLANAPLTICDTAHNEAGIKAIMEQLLATPHDQVHIVWGMVNDKETSNILKLLPKAAMYYFCKPNVPRGLDASTLAAVANDNGLNGSTYGDVNEAIQVARQNAGEEGVVFIGGSTFVVAEIDNL